MKICITAQDSHLDAQIDWQFEKCRYFIIVDTETAEFSAVENVVIDTMSGVNQQALTVSAEGVTAAVTGAIEQGALQSLERSGIKVITNVGGSVRSAFERYKNGEFK